MWATVNKARVYTWLALNVLYTIPSLIHIFFESRNPRPTIVDTAAVAVTTDVSKLVADKDVAELKWRNMSYVTKEDAFGLRKDNRILLKLQLQGSGFGLENKLD